MPVELKVHGLAELREALLSLPNKLRKRALRNALAAGARVFRDEAKRLAPVLSSTSPAVLRGIRKPGALRQAIRVRTSKQARRAGDVGVFVNVAPVRGLDRSAKNPRKYWHFVEFGTRKMAARPFLRPAAAAKYGEALAKISATLGPAIQKLNVPKSQG